jgi:hypothetical protein
MIAMTENLQTTSRTDMSRALHLAWIVWILLLLVTLAALVATILIVDGAAATETAPATARRWLWALAAYYLVVVIAAFFRTGWMFRGYYSTYQPVAPRTYLTGMSLVWAALAVGAWASLAVCAFTRTLLPNILLAAVGNVMLLALWPRGNALNPPAADPADPGHYQEPR